MTIQKFFTERLSFQWASYVTQWAKSNRLLTSQNFQGHVVSSSMWHLRTSRFFLQKWKRGRSGSSSPTSGYGLWKRLNSPPKLPGLAVSLPWPLLPWQFLLPSSEAHYSVTLLIFLSMSGNSDRKPGVKKQGSYGNDWKCRFLSSQTQNHLEILGKKKCSGHSENLFQTSYSKSTNFCMLQSAIILAVLSLLSVRMTISKGIPAFKEFWV